jgi:hypothetical protein
MRFADYIFIWQCQSLWANVQLNEENQSIYKARDACISQRQKLNLTMKDGSSKNSESDSPITPIFNKIIE